MKISNVEDIFENNEKVKIIAIDKLSKVFNIIKGSVVPKHFWNNETEFSNKGIGYSIFNEHNIPVSTAFSSFIIDNKIEIGIETDPDYRYKNLASAVCCFLINYCIKNKFEPIWSCHSGNIGSQKLAKRLGFEEKLRSPYYRLSN